MARLARLTSAHPHSTRCILFPQHQHLRCLGYPHVVNMSTPQAKRRRLNEATKILHKPFKSPFRTQLKAGIGSDPPSSDPPDTSTPTAEAAIATLPTAPNTATARLTNAARPVSHVAASTRAGQKKPMAKANMARETMHLRNEIQILSQAHALATSTKDDDLVVLIDRWKTASRAAAEELFANTRDRVNRMGGVGAWKEREREQMEWRRKADREEMEAERERLEEAKENGEMSEEAYTEYIGADAEQDQGEEVENFKGADDDVSLMRSDFDMFAR